MNVWRNNLVTGGDGARQFCINNNIMGCGWPINYDGKSLDWETYYRLGMERYYNIKERDNGWWPAVNAMYERIKLNDLCWTRDNVGVYYLGRVLSDWRYENKEANVKADIVNVRNCDWRKVGTIESIPGKIITSFIGKTIQRIPDETISIFSKYLYIFKLYTTSYDERNFKVTFYNGIFA